MTDHQNQHPSVFIDPSYEVFYHDRLFDLTDATLNRDDQLVPFSRLRDEFQKIGRVVHSADCLVHDEHPNLQHHYYSLGLKSYRTLGQKYSVLLKAFVIMEPPVVAPRPYAEIARLAREFDTVYVHNVEGDGYSLDGVERSKLKKFYWPIVYQDVLEPYWKLSDRQNRLVVINGNHNPLFRKGELYSTRIEAMMELAKENAVDLYGRGWNKWSRQALWLPYLLNRKRLLAIYRGPCKSKFEVLSKYTFCLCLENQSMKGYVSEKIFDCLYAGTIPVYLGAPDIADYVPAEAFVDCRLFPSWGEILKFLRRLSPQRVQQMRDAGRSFFASSIARKFYNSFQNIFDLQ